VKNLIEILKTDSRFVDDEGELVKAAVIDRAWKIDHDLVKLLLAEPDIKAKFFDEIEKHWIFNINTFIEYISDKNFLANSYTRFRNKIGLNIGSKFLRERGEVSLVWPYKDCVLEGGQTREEEKRKEIFFNEILAQDEIARLFDPKALTNWKRYTPDGKQKVTEIRRDENGTIKENLIIKGNNLLALHTLKKQFRSKVKLIYIDPPYNTGNDSFGYNDNFNHSSWLTFMKNRLEVAKELLHPQGNIFIQIDDFEDAYLKVLMDEIFGREHFRNKITWKRRGGSANPKNRLNNVTDYILWYSKTDHFKFEPIFSLDNDNTQKYIKERFNNVDEFDRRFMKSPLQSPNPRPNLIYDYKGYKTPKNGYSISKDVMKKWDSEGKLWFPKDKSQNINRKIYLDEYKGQPISSLWTDISVINPMSKERGEFENGQKPEALVYRILQMTTTEGDLVLDFFIGSGTLCSVAHKTKRQYIGIEQLDYIDFIPVNRMQNVLKGDDIGISKSVNWQGGGDFIYCELMKYNETFMDKIQAAKASKELVKIWKDIAENSFLNWYVNPEMPEDAISNFIAIGKTENGLERQKKLLAELLNKNQLYVNLSEIDDEDFKVSDEDKELNRLFYGEAYDD
jgi:adenine-specific DNA-methyltransferase